MANNFSLLENPEEILLKKYVPEIMEFFNNPLSLKEQLDFVIKLKTDTAKSNIVSGVGLIVLCVICLIYGGIDVFPTALLPLGVTALIGAPILLIVGLVLIVQSISKKNDAKQTEYSDSLP